MRFLHAFLAVPCDEVNFALDAVEAELHRGREGHAVHPRPIPIKHAQC